MTTVTAYAVHVDGGLWDDPEISAWCERIYVAAGMMERAEAFFADDEAFGLDEPGGGLLTIVRAVFTAEEWATVLANGWARPALSAAWSEDPTDTVREYAPDAVRRAASAIGASTWRVRADSAFDVSSAEGSVVMERNGTIRPETPQRRA